MKYVSRGKEFTSKYVLKGQKLNITLSLPEVNFSAAQTNAFFDKLQILNF